MSGIPSTTAAHRSAVGGFSQRSQTLLVLALALLPRLLVLWRVAAKYPATPFYSRGLEMGLLARSLVAGGGLSSPFGGPGSGAESGPTALIAPGYPILIAGIFRVFGTYSFASEMAIILLQIAANLITVWLMMHLARTLFDGRAAVVAGMIWACSPPLIFVPTICWDSSIAIAMLTGFFVFVLFIRRQSTREAWLLLGVYCALAALINPALLPVLVAGTLWLAWQIRRKSRTVILLAALSFLVVFAPWPVRNATVFHAFVPLRSTIGFELWMGNHPGASGALEENLFPTFNRGELEQYNRLGEIAYTRHKAELARTFILQNPATFLHLTALRAGRYWLGTGNPGGSLFFPAHAIFTTGFGLAGLWLLVKKRRRGLAVLFAIPLLLFPLPYYVTHAEFRYRLVIDPLLTILAAYALTSTRSRLDGSGRPASAETQSGQANERVDALASA